MAKLEKPYDDYKVLDLKSPGSRKRVVDQIAPPGRVWSGAAYAVLDNLFGRPGVRSAVVESNYIDVDHSRSYADFYARSFHDHSKRTERVHFFSRRVTSADLARLDGFAKDYLGYVVVRPLAVRSIGRTSLPPPASTGARFNFATVASSTIANVAGFPLAVHGCPFMEQDARVSACASASIWMATAPTVERLKLPPFTTAEITNFATTFMVGSRRVQAVGLRADQMSEALRRMGYEPIHLPIAGVSDAMSAIYPYVESGIAPIILLQLLSGFHVEACVGHTYDPAFAPAKAVEYDSAGSTPLRFWRSWQWADRLLVHDDQRGPYRQLRFITQAEIKAQFAASGQPGSLATYGADKWLTPVEVEHDYAAAPGGHPAGIPRSTIANVIGVIVPSPVGVTLSAKEAETKVAKVLEVWADTFSVALPADLCLRTYLASSNEFKAQLDARVSMHPFVRDFYRGKGLPHWLWITEVGLRSECITADPRASRIRGEILLDANGSPEMPDFVALHLPNLGAGGATGEGVLSSMGHGDADVPRALIDRWIVKADPPYERFTREWST